jgi:hypothetical protein
MFYINILSSAREKYISILLTPDTVKNKSFHYYKLANARAKRKLLANLEPTFKKSSHPLHLSCDNADQKRIEVAFFPKATMLTSIAHYGKGEWNRGTGEGDRRSC